MTDPDVIRRNIEQTRAELSQDVNALGDKVSPASIAKRQGDKVRDGVGKVRDAVMGAASDVKDSTSSTAGSVGDAVSSAPGTVKAKARGNPLAAGVIAFGVGLLVASLIPASEKEQQAAEAIKEKAQPLVEQATEAAKEVAGNLKEPAQEAVEQVKSTATDAAETVKEEGKSSVADVKDQAQQAKDSVQETRA